MINLTPTDPKNDLLKNHKTEYTCRSVQPMQEYATRNNRCGLLLCTIATLPPEYYLWFLRLQCHHSSYCWHPLHNIHVCTTRIWVHGTMYVYTECFLPPFVPMRNLNICGYRPEWQSRCLNTRTKFMAALRMTNWCSIINPQHACAAKVTVVDSVCLFVC